MYKKQNIALLIISIFLMFFIWCCMLAEITMWISYGNTMTAGEILAFITANGYETGDIINYCLRYVWPYWLLCTLLFGVGCWWLWTQATKTPKYRYWTITILIVLLLPFMVPGQPCCLAREVVCVVKQLRNIRLHRDDATDFVYQAKKVSNSHSREIYICSIGESLRYANLSLNGMYSRETTPHLTTQSQLHLYSDCFSNATLTQHALPMLLTGVTGTHFEQHFTRKTIAQAYRETGIYTILIAHRAQLMNNKYHDYLTHDFDSIIWVEHDSLIAPTLRQVMNMHTKLFVITHYLGNHMFYTNRTEDCLVWRPDYNADPKIKSDSLFLNAYDNSILYTDYLLNKEIEILKQSKGIASWFFISDHGEYIDHRVSGHGHTYHPTKDEYHVPLMVWYSDEYAAVYPDKVANMIKHKDEPVCGDHVFWSVLDMAGIEIDSTLQQEGMSIFGDSLRSYKRTLLLPDGKTIMEL